MSSVVYSGFDAYGERFKWLRVGVLKMTQLELSIELNCSRSHVSRVETGLDEYRFSEVQQMTVLLGVPVASFFDGYAWVNSEAEVEWVLDYLRLQPHRRGQLDAVLRNLMPLVS